MKKYLSLLSVMILFAQPAFSQCGPGGCPVQQQAYQPKQQIMQQPIQQGNRHYLQSYQPRQYVRQQQTYQPMQQAAPVCPQPCPPQVSQCAPNFFICPNLMQGMTGAAANLQAPYCQKLCPKVRSGWRVFVEDYLGFD